MTATTRVLTALTIVLCLFHQEGLAQRESDFGFFLITPNAQATAMGKVSVAFPFDDPLSHLSNPAHLGSSPMPEPGDRSGPASRARRCTTTEFCFRSRSSRSPRCCAAGFLIGHVDLRYDRSSLDPDE